MSDNETSLDIVIRTRADLEGAQSAEAQLDRDIEKARVLGQAYAAQDGSPGPESSDASNSGPPANDVTPGEISIAGPEPGDSGAPDSSANASVPDAGDFQIADPRVMEAQTQSIQAAGERMRAALEQNGQMTLELLNRTLALIDEQNQKLADVDRELGQLSGRIKGLRNP